MSEDGACHDITRIQKPRGLYSGLENNHTGFRKAFDGLQELMPIWERLGVRGPPSSAGP